MVRIACFILLLIQTTLCTAKPPRLAVLFLGDDGHHRPHDRFAQVDSVFAARGIRLTYTDRVEDLNAGNLRRYDALLLYANIDTLPAAQEKALLDYVTQGGGFVPIHCASFCFRNSESFVALVGGQFKSHGAGTFRPQIAAAAHPIMKGFNGFSSWDESYVHHKHNAQGRTVLSYRVDATHKEPWTWVREHGQGRVFYTAWGHDQRTWGNAGFQNLLERGIRWAAGGDPSVAGSYVAERPFPTPAMTSRPGDLPPMKYVDVGSKIPHYRPAGAAGGPDDSKMQQPLSAEESLRHIITPKGFRVELFAAEPDLGGKPITMAWDARGRLWVAETYDYPNELQPRGKGRDRIRICEDTNGDGRADKFTVFAEQLSIPTSIVFSRGGAIVQDGTETVFLKDTDGDDVADQRTVLFTGWSQSDTHGGVSNFQYGLDNWIWGMQGYNLSRPVVQGKPHQGFRQGFFRFRSDASELEFIRSTNNNTWGLGISEEGIIFGSTANRNPSVFMPIPNRYYERVRGWTSSLQLGSIADTHLFQPATQRVRQVDHHGGYTAAAGHALYTARRYPQPYWNQAAFVNGPTGHLVGTFVLRPNGSDFTSSNPFNLFASDDEWTAPIMAEVGPDGNVWVIDWYNYIVQHNPTPQGFKTGKGNAYETDLRDKRHGRIYRVVYPDASNPHAAPNDLTTATPAELVATLAHPTMLWRKHAQRLLVERARTDVLPDLLDLVNDRSVDAIGLNVGAIHALWTLHGLGLLEAPHPEAIAAAQRALDHPAAGVRRNAALVLPRHPKSTQALLASGVLQDPNPQVRLAALLALADLPGDPRAGQALVTTLTAPGNSGDRWLRDAATSAAATHDAAFLQAAAGVQSTTPELLETTATVAEHFARAAPVQSLGELISESGQAPPDVAAAIVRGLAKGWPADQKPPMTKALETELQQLGANLPATEVALLIKLARGWGSTSFEKLVDEVIVSLLKQLGDENTPAGKRLDAARELIRFRPQDNEAVGQLLQRISPQTPPELAVALLGTLRESRAPQLGKTLVARLRGLTPAGRSEALRVLLARPSSTVALLAALEAGKVQLTELSLDQQQALSVHPDKSIRARAQGVLKRGGALPNPDRQRVLATLMPLAQRQGDAAAGKQVFKKQCAKCHIHSGEGNRVGPDLTGMAVHPKSELLTHIIDPSRSVESNFRVYTVATVEGVVITGLLWSESKTAIELFDAEGKKQVVLREDIDELVASPKSLMPDGFEKQVPEADLVNLLEFLAQRGRFVPIDLGKFATITSARGMFYNKQATVERLIFSDWSPKTFAGVPFQLTDPEDGQKANVVMLHGPLGDVSRAMPKSVVLPCNGPVRAIHLLSGVSGWGFPFDRDQSVSMIVRLHYVDGKTEDHALRNAVHFADYIRRIDVPESQFAFALRGQQIRYLSVEPQRPVAIKTIELVKGPNRTAPIVMAVTLETAANE